MLIQTAMKKILILTFVCATLLSKADYWTQKASFPGPGRQVPSSFVIGNNGYVSCGDQGTLFNDLWEYNSVTNIWTQKANLPAAGRFGAVGFSINNKGYIGTGYGFNDFWEYNPVTNAWTQKTNFGGTGRSYAVGFSIGNKGYIGLGGVREH